MTLHDTDRFKQEEADRLLKRKRNQKKLKAFYDKQVREKELDQQFVEQKKIGDFQTQVHTIEQFDKEQRRRKVIREAGENLAKKTNHQQVASKSIEKIKQRRDVSNERQKLDRQISDILKKEKATQESEKKLKKGVIDSYNNQLMYETKMKEMATKMNHEEERQAAQNQTEQFVKIRKDYERKFDVIEEKEKKIQKAYGELSPDILSLAKAEKTRDQGLNKLIDDRYHRYNKDYAEMLDKRDYQRRTANDNAKTENIKSHVEKMAVTKKNQDAEIVWEKSNIEKTQQVKEQKEQERIAKRR